MSLTELLSSSSSSLLSPSVSSKIARSNFYQLISKILETCDFLIFINHIFKIALLIFEQFCIYLNAIELELPLHISHLQWRSKVWTQAWLSIIEFLVAYRNCEEKEEFRNFFVSSNNKRRFTLRLSVITPFTNFQFKIISL